VTEDAWKRQAERLAAAWPSPPMTNQRAAVYFDVLKDLGDAQVEAAVSELLGEDRADMPPPGVIRARALAAKPVGPDVAAAVDDHGGEGTAAGAEAKDGLFPIGANARQPWKALIYTATVAGLLILAWLVVWGVWRALDTGSDSSAAPQEDRGQIERAVQDTVDGWGENLQVDRCAPFPAPDEANAQWECRLANARGETCVAVAIAGGSVVPFEIDPALRGDGRACATE
jgi:hypothetical protein